MAFCAFAVWSGFEAERLYFRGDKAKVLKAASASFETHAPKLHSLDLRSLPKEDPEYGGTIANCVYANNFNRRSSQGPAPLDMAWLQHCVEYNATNSAFIALRSAYIAAVGCLLSGVAAAGFAYRSLRPQGGASDPAP